MQARNMTMAALVAAIMTGCSSSTDGPNDSGARPVGLASNESGELILTGRPLTIGSAIGSDGVELRGSVLNGSLLVLSEEGTWRGTIGCESRSGIYRGATANEGAAVGPGHASSVGDPVSSRSAFQFDVCETSIASETADALLSIVEELFASEVVRTVSSDMAATLSTIDSMVSITVEPVAESTAVSVIELASGFRRNDGLDASTALNAVLLDPLTLLSDEDSLGRWLEEYGLADSGLASLSDPEVGALVAYDAGFFGDRDVPRLRIVTSDVVAGRLSLEIELEEPYGCGLSQFDPGIERLTPLGPYALWQFPETRLDTVTVINRTRLGPEGELLLCED